MSEWFLAIASVLLAITVGATIEYCRILRKAQKEYERAKCLIEDITLSFSRQLKQDASNLERLAYKVETVSSKVDSVLRQSTEMTKIAESTETKIVLVREETSRANSRLDEVENQIRDAAASQETLLARVGKLEDQTKRIPIPIQQNAEAVIPFKRDKVLAPLTPTELTALDFLAAEGPRTAPEIRWKIRLSREHTARLMKKLYESGYLERDTSKIPFKYSVKKEMEELLKKAEG